MRSISMKMMISILYNLIIEKELKKIGDFKNDLFFKMTGFK